jgi:phosphoribosylaminoimidazole-succinocarboxamide synthase
MQYAHIEGKVIDDNSLINSLSSTKKLVDNSYTLIKSGKVRDIYQNKLDYGNTQNYTFIASDRISSFDRHLTTIPYKGIVLHKISKWWFEKTKHIVPNHVIDCGDERVMIVKKCRVFPIEFVMRSYLTGNTETSIWKNYEKGCRNYCGHILPDNMVKNQKLPNILLTPTTKSMHDELISEEEIIQHKIMTQEQWNTCKEYSHKLFEFGQKLALENGIILVDTKYEFGVDENNNIVLVDELHTPDSSRYWLPKSSSYDKEYKSIDKDIVRNWVKENYEDPYDLDIQIEVPDSVRKTLAMNYLLLHRMITNESM